MKRIIFIVLILAGFLSLATAGAPTYIGTWIRQAIYLNEKLVSSEPAELVFKRDSYTSKSSVCATSGKISVSGSSMTMVMTKSSCPNSGVKLPYTVENIYNVSGDNKTLVIVTGPMKEVYLRK